MRAYMASKAPRDKSKPKKTALPKSERRQQILSVARDVFARRGYHQTTIDDIALQAGLDRSFRLAAHDGDRAHRYR
jgi:AcrR family transcriptional regulator